MNMKVLNQRRYEIDSTHFDHQESLSWHACAADT